MRCKHTWLGIVLFALLVALALPWTGVAEEEFTEDVLPPQADLYEEELPDDWNIVTAHNYILIIDNSRSTTGRHSLGAATDPKGLRFDAARLVYNNVVSAAATGARGKIGVIVFCGTENCVSYGPLDIDDPQLEEQIGSLLNEAANANRRDDYTDIRTALQTAKGMLDGFEDETSVILLTDGVNDLTNKANPFTRPENIQANADSVALVGEMHQEGADFQIVALTTKADLSEDDPLMVFINQLAEAGGGEAQEDGSYGNVLKATQADLDSKLVQMLIKAESASEYIQTIVNYTPVDSAFLVPYEGIADVTVNLTFMPEDKAKLDRVALVAPDGAVYDLWQGGEAREQAGISITEDRSYIMLRVPNPEAGEWHMQVSGQVDASGDEARVLLNAVVRLNHSLRIIARMPATAGANELVRVTARFQRYDGENFVDLEDSGIYEQSEATLTMIAPDGTEKSGTMKWNGEQYAIGFRPKVTGQWGARVLAVNPYYREGQENIHLEVVPASTPSPEPVAEATPTPTLEPTPTPGPGETPAPTPTPTPEPTPSPTPSPSPTPKVVPIEDFTVAVSSVTTVNDENYLIPGSMPVIVAWQVEGKTDYVEGELLENGEVIQSGIQSGDSLDRAAFKEGAQYELRISAMPKNGTLVDYEPTVESVLFQAAPAVVPVENIEIHIDPQVGEGDGFIYVDGGAEQITPSWTIDGEADFAVAALMKDGAALRTVQSGEGMDPADFEINVDYELQISAMPKNGTIVKEQPVTYSQVFRVIPPAQPVEGLSVGASGVEPKDGVYALKNNQATLSWGYGSGDVDHYELTVKDPEGNVYLQDSIGGNQTEYTFTMQEEGDYRVALTAVPRYALDDENNRVTEAVVRPHIATFIEKYWYFIAGGAALLVAAIVGLVLLIQTRAPKVVGAMRVRCEELSLDAKLAFADERKGVKLASPITAHRTLAKLKGKKAYALLKNVRADMVRANNLGRVASDIGGPETQARNDAITHRPNERLIRLLYTDPATKRQDVCFVGRHDIEATAMELSDGGKTYVFEFGSPNAAPARRKEEPVEATPAEPVAETPAEPVEEVRAEFQEEVREASTEEFRDETSEESHDETQL